MRSRSRFLLALVAVALPALLDAQVSDVPSFRADVNLVRVPVRVVDKSGHSVTDLSMSECHVLEDGRPQSITSFDRVQMAARQTDGARFGRTDETTRGVYLLFFDDYHLSTSDVLRVRRTARFFIQNDLGAGDLVGIVMAGGGGLDLTADHEGAIKALEKVRSRPSVTSAAERQVTSQLVLRAVTAASDWLNQHFPDQRKAVLLFSAGIGCDGVAGRESCGQSLSSTTEKARTASVTIYSIPPVVDGDFLGADYEGGLPIPDNEPGSPDSAAKNRDRNWGPMSALMPLAVDTGGFVAGQTNDLKNELREIVQNETSYYVVGYYSTNTNVDGRSRRIQLNVDRKGVRLFYRQRYIAIDSR